MVSRKMMTLTGLLIFFPLASVAANHCRRLPRIKHTSLKKVSTFGEYSGYSPVVYDSWVRQSRYLKMANGSRLAIDIIYPAKNCVITKHKLPIILTQTPYQRAYTRIDGSVTPAFEDEELGLEKLIRHGYIFSAVAISGTAASHGIFTGMFSPIERRQAYQVIEWLAKQPFSNGKVGMIGGSYQGIDQYMAASKNPPHLKAIFPQVSCFNAYNFVYPGGIYRRSITQYWTQMISNINQLRSVVPVDNDPLDYSVQQARIEHRHNVNTNQQLASVPFYDDQAHGFNWVDNNPAEQLKKINHAAIPAYIVGGWYDSFMEGTLFWYTNYKGPKKMAIGAWPHNTNGAPKVLADSRAKVVSVEALRWFDYWLKGIQNHIMSEPSVHYNTLDKDYVPGNWHSSVNWPPKHVRKRVYMLAANHSLVSNHTQNRTESVNYTIDYATSTGQSSRWTNTVGQGFINYNTLSINDKKSIVYTSGKLPSKLVMTGFPTITLYLSSTAEDVDLHVVLEEVDKQGVSHYLTEGMLRASHRKIAHPHWKHYGLPYHSHRHKDIQYLVPGKVAKCQFYLYPFSRVLPAGSRIRVAVMGADQGNTDTLFLSKPITINVFANSKITLPVM